MENDLNLKNDHAQGQERSKNHEETISKCILLIENQPGKEVSLSQFKGKYASIYGSDIDLGGMSLSVFLRKAGKGRLVVTQGEKSDHLVQLQQTKANALKNNQAKFPAFNVISDFCKVPAAKHPSQTVSKVGFLQQNSAKENCKAKSLQLGNAHSSVLLRLKSLFQGKEEILMSEVATRYTQKYGESPQWPNGKRLASLVGKEWSKFFILKGNGKFRTICLVTSKSSSLHQSYSSLPNKTTPSPEKKGNTGAKPTSLSTPSPAEGAATKKDCFSPLTKTPNKSTQGKCTKASLPHKRSKNQQINIQKGNTQNPPLKANCLTTVPQHQGKSNSFKLSAQHKISSENILSTQSMNKKVPTKQPALHQSYSSLPNKTTHSSEQKGNKSAKPTSLSTPSLTEGATTKKKDCFSPLTKNPNKSTQGKCKKSSLPHKSSKNQQLNTQKGNTQNPSLKANRRTTVSQQQGKSNSFEAPAQHKFSSDKHILSTQSMDKKVPTKQPAVTKKEERKWLFHWVDEDGILIPYPATLQAELQHAFDNGTQVHYTCPDNGQEYIIEPKQQVQTNKRYKTQKAVKAMFSDANSPGGLPTGRPNAPNEWLPRTWALSNKEGNRPKVLFVRLQHFSAEFQGISKLFHSSLDAATYSIEKIERVQNETLYQEFYLCHKNFEKDLGLEEMQVKQLFHGTTSDVIPQIAKIGFDWRVCGKNATAYGKGSYFAKNSSYSDSYSKENSQTRMKAMFVAKVITGKPARGNSSILREPDGCHCTVDSISSPTIYVIYHIKQAYPEYIIYYSSKRTNGVYSSQYSVTNSSSYGNSSTNRVGTSGSSSYTNTNNHSYGRSTVHSSYNSNQNIFPSSNSGSSLHANAKTSNSNGLNNVGTNYNSHQNTSGSKRSMQPSYSSNISSPNSPKLASQQSQYSSHYSNPSRSTANNNSKESEKPCSLM